MSEDRYTWGEQAKRLRRARRAEHRRELERAHDLVPAAFSTGLVIGMVFAAVLASMINPDFMEATEAEPAAEVVDE